MALTDIFKLLIDATRLIDTRIERLEAQLNNVNTKLTLLSRQLEAMRAKAGGWEDVKVLTNADVLEAFPRKNSDPRQALPSDEELFAGLESVFLESITR